MNINEMNLNELVNEMYDIVNANNLGDHLKSKIDDLRDNIHEDDNVYDYAITAKAVEVLNKLFDALYDSTVERYGKEAADTWVSPEKLHVDVDELYDELMKNVCF